MMKEDSPEEHHVTNAPEHAPGGDTQHPASPASFVVPADMTYA